MFERGCGWSPPPAKSSQQRRHPGYRPAAPVLHGSRRRYRRDDGGLLLAVARARLRTQWCGPATSFAAPIPIRGAEIAELTARLVGLGAVGRAVRWAVRAGPAGHRARRPATTPATTLTSCWRTSINALHAAVTDDAIRMIGAWQFAACDGAVFLQHRPVTTARHRCARRRLRGKLAPAWATSPVNGAGRCPLVSMPNRPHPHRRGHLEHRARQARMVADDLGALLSAAGPPMCGGIGLMNFVDDPGIRGAGGRQGRRVASGWSGDHAGNI